MEVGEDGKARIHHWSEHCDDHIHRRLGRKGERFSDGMFPKLGKMEIREREKAERVYAEKWPEEWKSLGKRHGAGHPAGVRRGTDGHPTDIQSASAGTVPCLALPCLKTPLPPEGVGEGGTGEEDLGGEWCVERLHGELVKTGKFPNLTGDGVAQAVRAWPGWEGAAGRVVGEARCLGDPRVGNPLVWLNRVLGRYVGVEKDGGGKAAPAAPSRGSGYVPLGERQKAVGVKG